MSKRSGATIICETIERLGIDCVFGLPGTQTVELFEALRRSSLRTILTTSELAASFMANGYARASGRPGVLVTIPGPEFSYAMPGLAEAFYDSVPLVHIVPRPEPALFDQARVAGAVAKSVCEVDAAADLERTLVEACSAAMASKPGPVVVQVAGHVLSDSVTEGHGTLAELPIADLPAVPPRAPRRAEPRFPDITPPTAAAFFAALEEAMPAGGILVTDSGRHQVLARAHFHPGPQRGFIVPSEFQSMGFGLPASIGAKHACADRAVVALIGDGGFAISAMEMLTAVRNEIPVTVIVFNDGALGQIRLEQITAHGEAHATSLLNPDFEKFAAAVGVAYFRVSGNPAGTLREAIQCGSVSLVEVRLEESVSFHVRKALAILRAH